MNELRKQIALLTAERDAYRDELFQVRKQLETLSSKALSLAIEKQQLMDKLDAFSDKLKAAYVRINKMEERR